MEKHEVETQLAIASLAQTIAMQVLAETLASKGITEKSLFDATQEIGNILTEALAHFHYSKELSGHTKDRLFQAYTMVKVKKEFEEFLPKPEFNAHDCDNCKHMGQCPIEDQVRIQKMQFGNLAEKEEENNNHLFTKFKELINVYKQKQNEN